MSSARPPRIVLAYSGGRASSRAIAELAASRGAEVVALTVDFGRGRALENVRDRALADGAVRAHVLDARDEFARDYLLPALAAGALVRGGRSLAKAVARPLIAARLVEIAAIEQTTAIACAADVPAIAAAARTLNPNVEVVSCGGAAAPEQSGAGAAAPQPDRPGEPAFVDITFRRGMPSAINDIAMPLPDLISSLDFIAGAHGIGGADGVDTPAIPVLHAAHASIFAAAADADTARVSASIAEEYARAIESGSWFAPLRRTLTAFVDAANASASGVVRLKLFTRICEIVETRPDASRLESDEHPVVRPLRYRA